VTNIVKQRDYHLLLEHCYVVRKAFNEIWRQ